jgi:signal transduction histidine kinase
VRKQALLESGIAGDLPGVMLDPGRLEQVLVNLLVNAAQASRGADAWVRLSVGRAEEPGWIELSVADNGAGIPADQIDQIFDPFFTTKEQGTGLGLWICHQIVEDHGGRLRVESEPGVGSTFRVLLPVAPP